MKLFILIDFRGNQARVYAAKCRKFLTCENPNSVFLTDVVSIMGDQKPVEPPGLESIDLVKMNTGRLKTADSCNLIHSTKNNDHSDLF